MHTWGHLVVPLPTLHQNSCKSLNYNGEFHEEFLLFPDWNLPFPDVPRSSNSKGYKKPFNLFERQSISWNIPHEVPNFSLLAMSGFPGAVRNTWGLKNYGNFGSLRNFCLSSCFYSFSSVPWAINPSPDASKGNIPGFWFFFLHPGFWSS